MRKAILLILLLFIINQALAQQARLKALCQQFDDFNTAVRDGKLKKHNAMPQFQKLIAQIRENAATTADESWTFPLQGYNTRAIGGTNGNGYSAAGYSYFDGNRHLAHPAHDIFINDRNQDCIDDRTRRPVNVLAVADGVVIACSNEWSTQSALRGGRYIWIYHPNQNILTYYAHNRELFIAPGDVVKAGQKIAEVGRTGFNAYKKRSPTHLHFSAYNLTNNLPVVYNPFTELLKSQKK